MESACMSPLPPKGEGLLASTIGFIPPRSAFYFVTPSDRKSFWAKGGLVGAGGRVTRLYQ